VVEGASVNQTGASMISIEDRAAFLYQLRNRIRTQDNRITADPLFVVFEKFKFCGLDPQFADDDQIEWQSVDGEYVIEGDEREALEKKFQETGEIDTDHQRVAFREFDRFITACFTEAAADAFIAANKNNLKKPYVYVVSLQRNPEMKMIRDLLRGEN
jgi:hypothetical protein